MMRQSKPILLVEDDVVDAMTAERALKELGIKNELKKTCNGEEALDYLREADNEKPCLIFLDLNMPRMSGLEFLEIIKQDDDLKSIPVVVLTTSKEESDKMASFKCSVAGYMVKPVDYDEFIEVIRTLDEYWTASEMPDDARSPKEIPARSTE